MGRLLTAEIQEIRRTPQYLRCQYDGGIPKNHMGKRAPYDLRWKTTYGHMGAGSSKVPRRLLKYMHMRGARGDPENRGISVEIDFRYNLKTGNLEYRGIPAKLDFPYNFKTADPEIGTSGNRGIAPSSQTRWRPYGSKWGNL